MVSGPLVDLVGGHRTMLVANVVAGLSTLATPWLVEQSLLGLVTCQVIAGTVVDMWILHANYNHRTLICHQT